MKVKGEKQMEELYMGILGKSNLENIAELWLAIRDIKNRLNSPTYGPMLPDEADEPRS